MLQHTNNADRLPDRTVVIGAAGFVGGALMGALKAAGANALGITRREVDLVMPDAADKLAALLKPGDAVVAVSAAAPCKDITTMIANMVMTRAMIDAIARVSVSHVANISSDAVYADGPLPLTESTPTAPGSMHGAMHLAREIAFCSSVKAPLAILRPTFLYGTNDPHNGYGPNRFRRLANDGKDITLFGEGEERRDHVLIDDVAEVIMRVLKRRSTGTLNIATGDVHSFRAIADKVVAASPGKVAIKGSPRSAPMPHDGHRPFDIAAVRQAFPDFTFTGLADGIVRVQQELQLDKAGRDG